MGKGEYRVLAAEALLASMKSSAASPETVEKILQASRAALHFGILETKDATCMFLF